MLHHPYYIVAIVGLCLVSSSRARGILERSGLIPVHFWDSEEALRALTERLQVDAILLDGSCARDEQDEATVERLVTLSAAPPWADGPVPVIIMTSQSTPERVRRLGGTGRVQTIRRRHLGYRDLGRLIPRLCGARRGASDLHDHSFPRLRTT
jgi:CheY-like chemotaxis protein